MTIDEEIITDCLLQPFQFCCGLLMLQKCRNLGKFLPAGHFSGRKQQKDGTDYKRKNRRLKCILQSYSGFYPVLMKFYARFFRFCNFFCSENNLYQLLL